VLEVAEQPRAAAVFQERRDLIGMKGGVQRDGGAACSNNTNVNANPTRVIVGENCDPRAPITWRT